MMDANPDGDARTDITAGDDGAHRAVANANLRARSDGRPDATTDNRTGLRTDARTDNRTDANPGDGPHANPDVDRDLNAAARTRISIALSTHDPLALRFLRRLGLWSLAAAACSGPSYALAVTEGGFDSNAIVLAVVLYVLCLTAVTCTGWFEHFYRRPFIRQSLRFGYGARMALALVLPISFVLDAMLGSLSVGLFDTINVPTSSFAGTFLLTLVHGTVLNLSVAVIIVFVYMMLWLRHRGIDPSIDPYACRDCGYDLRVTTVAQRCPECGRPRHHDAPVLKPASTGPSDEALSPDDPPAANR